MSLERFALVESGIPIVLLLSESRSRANLGEASDLKARLLVNAVVSEIITKEADFSRARLSHRRFSDLIDRAWLKQFKGKGVEKAAEFNTVIDMLLGDRVDVPDFVAIVNKIKWLPDALKRKLQSNDLAALYISQRDIFLQGLKECILDRYAGHAELEWGNEKFSRQEIQHALNLVQFDEQIRFVSPYLMQIEYFKRQAMRAVNTVISIMAPIMACKMNNDVDNQTEQKYIGKLELSFYAFYQGTLSWVELFEQLLSTIKALKNRQGGFRSACAQSLINLIDQLVNEQPGLNIDWSSVKNILLKAKSKNVFPFREVTLTDDEIRTLEAAVQELKKIRRQEPVQPILARLEEFEVIRRAQHDYENEQPEQIENLGTANRELAALEQKKASVKERDLEAHSVALEVAKAKVCRLQEYIDNAQSEFDGMAKHFLRDWNQGEFSRPPFDVCENSTHLQAVGEIQFNIKNKIEELVLKVEQVAKSGSRVSVGSLNDSLRRLEEMCNQLAQEQARLRGADNAPVSIEPVRLALTRVDEAMQKRRREEELELQAVGSSSDDPTSDGDDLSDDGLSYGDDTAQAQAVKNYCSQIQANFKQLGLGKNIDLGSKLNLPSFQSGLDQGDFHVINRFLCTLLTEIQEGSIDYPDNVDRKNQVNQLVEMALAVLEGSINPQTNPFRSMVDLAGVFQRVKEEIANKYILRSPKNSDLYRLLDRFQPKLWERNVARCLAVLERTDSFHRAQGLTLPQQAEDQRYYTSQAIFGSYENDVVTLTQKAPSFSPLPAESVVADLGDQYLLLSRLAVYFEKSKESKKAVRKVNENAEAIERVRLVYEMRPVLAGVLHYDGVSNPEKLHDILSQFGQQFDWIEEQFAQAMKDRGTRALLAPPHGNGVLEFYVNYLNHCPFPTQKAKERIFEMASMGMLSELNHIKEKLKQPSVVIKDINVARAYLEGKFKLQIDAGFNVTPHGVTLPVNEPQTQQVIKALQDVYRALLENLSNENSLERIDEQMKWFSRVQSSWFKQDADFSESIRKVAKKCVQLALIDGNFQATTPETQEKRKRALKWLQEGVGFGIANSNKASQLNKLQLQELIWEELVDLDAKNTPLHDRFMQDLMSYLLKDNEDSLPYALTEAGLGQSIPLMLTYCSKDSLLCMHKYGAILNYIARSKSVVDLFELYCKNMARTGETDFAAFVSEARTKKARLLTVDQRDASQAAELSSLTFFLINIDELVKKFSESIPVDVPNFNDAKLQQLISYVVNYGDDDDRQILIDRLFHCIQRIEDLDDPRVEQLNDYIIKSGVKSDKERLVNWLYKRVSNPKTAREWGFVRFVLQQGSEDQQKRMIESVLINIADPERTTGFLQDFEQFKTCLEGTSYASKLVDILKNQELDLLAEGITRISQAEIVRVKQEDVDADIFAASQRLYTQATSKISDRKKRWKEAFENLLENGDIELAEVIANRFCGDEERRRVADYKAAEAAKIDAMQTAERIIKVLRTGEFWLSAANWSALTLVGDQVVVGQALSQSVIERDMPIIAANEKLTGDILEAYKARIGALEAQSARVISDILVHPNGLGQLATKLRTVSPSSSGDNFLVVLRSTLRPSSSVAITDERYVDTQFQGCLGEDSMQAVFERIVRELASFQDQGLDVTTRNWKPFSLELSDLAHLVCLHQTKRIALLAKINLAQKFLQDEERISRQHPIHVVLDILKQFVNLDLQGLARYLGDGTVLGRFDIACRRMQLIAAMSQENQDLPHDLLEKELGAGADESFAWYHRSICETLLDRVRKQPGTVSEVEAFVDGLGTDEQREFLRNQTQVEIEFDQIIEMVSSYDSAFYRDGKEPRDFAFSRLTLCYDQVSLDQQNTLAMKLGLVLDEVLAYFEKVQLGTNKSADFLVEFGLENLAKLCSFLEKRRSNDDELITKIGKVKKLVATAKLFLYQYLYADSPVFIGVPGEHVGGASSWPSNNCLDSDGRKIIADRLIGYYLLVSHFAPRDEALPVFHARIRGICSAYLERAIRSGAGAKSYYPARLNVVERLFLHLPQDTVLGSGLIRFQTNQRKRVGSPYYSLCAQAHMEEALAKRLALRMTNLFAVCCQEGCERLSALLQENVPTWKTQQAQLMSDIRTGDFTGVRKLISSSNKRVAAAALELVSHIEWVFNKQNELTPLMDSVQSVLEIFDAVEKNKDRNKLLSLHKKECDVFGAMKRAIDQRDSLRTSGQRTASFISELINTGLYQVAATEVWSLLRANQHQSEGLEQVKLALRAHIMKIDDDSVTNLLGSGLLEQLGKVDSEFVGEINKEIKYIRASSELSGQLIKVIALVSETIKSGSHERGTFHDSRRDLLTLLRDIKITDNTCLSPTRYEMVVRQFDSILGLILDPAPWQTCLLARLRDFIWVMYEKYKWCIDSSGGVPDTQAAMKNLILEVELLDEHRAKDEWGSLGEAERQALFLKPEPFYANHDRSWFLQQSAADNLINTGVLGRSYQSILNWMGQYFISKGINDFNDGTWINDIISDIKYVCAADMSILSFMDYETHVRSGLDYYITALNFQDMPQLEQHLKALSGGSKTQDDLMAEKYLRMFNHIKELRESVKTKTSDQPTQVRCEEAVFLRARIEAAKNRLSVSNDARTPNLKITECVVDFMRVNQVMMVQPEVLRSRKVKSGAYNTQFEAQLKRVNAEVAPFQHFINMTDVSRIKSIDQAVNLAIQEGFDKVAGVLMAPRLPEQNGVAYGVRTFYTQDSLRRLRQFCSVDDTGIHLNIRPDHMLQDLYALFRAFIGCVSVISGYPPNQVQEIVDIGVRLFNAAWKNSDLNEMIQRLFTAFEAHIMQYVGTQKFKHADLLYLTVKLTKLKEQLKINKFLPEKFAEEFILVCNVFDSLSEDYRIQLLTSLNDLLYAVQENQQAKIAVEQKFPEMRTDSTLIKDLWSFTRVRILKRTVNEARPITDEDVAFLVDRLSCNNGEIAANVLQDYVLRQEEFSAQAQTILANINLDLKQIKRCSLLVLSVLLGRLQKIDTSSHDKEGKLQELLAQLKENMPALLAFTEAARKDQEERQQRSAQRRVRLTSDSPRDEELSSKEKKVRSMLSSFFDLAVEKGLERDEADPDVVAGIKSCFGIPNDQPEAQVPAMKAGISLGEVSGLIKQQTSRAASDSLSRAIGSPRL